MNDRPGSAPIDKPEIVTPFEILLFLDGKQQVQRVSDPAPDFFQVSLEEMIGKRVGELFTTEPLLDLHLLLRNRPEAIRAFPARAALGERPVAVTAHPLHTVAGSSEETHYLVVVKPVTPGRPPLAQFEGVQITPTEFVTHLSRGFAHKFNNILTILSGYTELLGMEPEPSEIVQDAIRQLQGVSDEARKLIDFLLRIGGLIGIDPQPVAPEEVLGMAAAATARELSLTPTLALPEGSALTFFCDASRTSEILRELALNASEAGATEVRFEVELPQPDVTYAVITVTDNGSGIRQNPVDQVFYPCVTSHDPEVRYGVGLAAARGTAQAMRGRLELRSTEPGRTIFELQLPAGLRG